MRHGMNPGGECGPDSVAWQYRDGLAVGTQSNITVSVLGQAGLTPRMRVLRSGFPGGLVASISNDIYAGPGRRVLAYYESLERGLRRTGGIYQVVLNDTTVSRLRTIRLTGKKKLVNFTLQGQQEVRGVDLSGSDALEVANFNQNAFLSQVNLARCKSLQQMYFINCDRLQTFSFSERSRATLSVIQFFQCPLLEKRLSLKGMTNLTTFLVNNTYLGETADFSDTLVSDFDGQYASFRRYVLGPNFYSTTFASNQFVKQIDATNSAYFVNLDAASSTLESLTLFSGYNGQNGKATIYVNGTQMGETALVTMLNALGDATGNSKCLVDISNCPGTGTAAVNAAGNSAVARGWNIYGLT